MKRPDQAAHPARRSWPPPPLGAAFVALIFAVAQGCGDSSTEPVRDPPGQGTATAVVSISGDEQSGGIGTSLADSLVVRVITAEGSGVAGRAVDFVVTAGGGRVTPVQVITDGGGFAATRWRLGYTGGDQRAEARVAGLAGSPVGFAAFAVEDTIPAAIILTAVSDLYDAVLDERDARAPIRALLSLLTTRS
jgi:hypothetical protein